MPRSTSRTIHKTTLRKKAATWLMSVGLVAGCIAAPAVAQQCPTDSQIQQLIIQASIAEYQSTGHLCACPYNTASDGSLCGGRSAWSRSGGAEPLCYPSQVTEAMVAQWKLQNNFYTYTSGTGATFLQLCFSREGTVMQFESPAGFEHLRSGGSGEGYALCSSAGVHGFEAGVAAAGFGTPTITQPGGPNTLPLTITRTTTNGVFQLTQTFARDTAEHDVTLTMAVKNLSSVAQSNVRLSRYAHGALDNGAGQEEYDTTPDTVWGRDIHGLMLTALTFGIVHTTAVEAFSDWNPLGSVMTARGCDAIAQPLPTTPGNFVGRVTYSLGTINAGSSKTIKVVYRRF